MRYRLLGLALVLPALLTVGARGQDEEKKAPPPASNPTRYGFDYNPTLYPQKTPKETMASIVKAIDTKRVDYLLAQLADPKFVDGQVAQYRSLFPNGTEAARTFLAFEKVTGATVQHLLADPILVKEMRLFARDAAWEEKEDNTSVGTLKDVPARKVFLKRIGERWYLENRQQ